MKKVFKFFMYTAMAVAVVASCTKEDAPAGENKPGNEQKILLHSRLRLRALGQSLLMSVIGQQLSLLQVQVTLQLLSM